MRCAKERRFPIRSFWRRTRNRRSVADNADGCLLSSSGSVARLFPWKMSAKFLPNAVVLCKYVEGLTQRACERRNCTRIQRGMPGGTNIGGAHHSENVAPGKPNFERARNAVNCDDSSQRNDEDRITNTEDWRMRKERKSALTNQMSPSGIVGVDLWHLRSPEGKRLKEKTSQTPERTL